METTESGEETTYAAFLGEKLLVAGDRKTLLLRVKKHLESGGGDVLIFEDQTGRQVDFDFQGTAEEVLSRVETPLPKTGPGRPKLGVQSREVSLLPRQWEWLEAQPNGASAALRRLVDEARKREPEKERARVARDAAGKVLWSLAGNLPGFEEASRSLYAADWPKVGEIIRKWPKDIRKYVERLVDEAAKRSAEALAVEGRASISG